MIVFRWLARITGLLIVGFLALLMIGEGMNVQAMLPIEQMIAGSILVAMLGMVVLWKWVASADSWSSSLWHVSIFLGTSSLLPSLGAGSFRSASCLVCSPS